MLKPVLEVYIVRHPDDPDEAQVAADIAEHFHGGTYTSLLGGSMEVYERCAGWTARDAAPRPIRWPSGTASDLTVQPAEFVAIVPLIGTNLNRALQRSEEWQNYFRAILEQSRSDRAHVRVFPIRVSASETADALSELLPPKVQYAGEQDAHAVEREPDQLVRCRDLAQFMAQWISPVDDDQLQVFISHTKRLGTPEEPVAALVEQVRSVFNASRIGTFYDAHDLQVGDDWDRALRRDAASKALLALRTDLYATREWCQREMLAAKTHGMPVVVLDALSAGEARGSFLMDHTPRIPVRRGANGEFDSNAIRRAINMLADGWLRRALWLRLMSRASQLPYLAAYWWAPQSPEPSTLTQWLGAETTDDPEVTAPPRIQPLEKGKDVRILHPDPPLSEDERKILQQIVSLAGYGALDLTTPRLLAARGA